MSEKEYHKCSVEKGFCKILEMYTQPTGKHKGLSFYNILCTIENTIGIKTIGVICRKKQRDNGIFLNYCPFCGEDLEPFRKDHVKQGEKQC